VTIRALLIFLLTGMGVFAQEKPQNFVLDPSKPFAYLKFDHVADRKPVSSDEIARGLWLRLVNNCRVPIRMEIFDPGTGDPGIGVYDDIVMTYPNTGFHPGKLGQQSTGSKAKQPTANPPKGYSPPEVVSTTIIPPGSSLLFSVPFNHVGPSWRLQVKFNLAPPESMIYEQPYSIVSFGMYDLPPKY
jgi:hypothetical protein